MRLRRIALLLAVNLAVLAAAEGICAIVLHSFERDLDTITNDRDPERRAVRLSGQVVSRMGETLVTNMRDNVLTYPDPELLFRVRPNPSGESVNGYSGINSLGFRGGEWHLEDPRPRILLVGDSCTFGWRVANPAHTWGGRLQALFPDWNVLNLGQPGYSSAQAVRLFRRWLKTLGPRVVVLYLGWNDVWPSGVSDEQLLATLRYTNPVRGLLHKSHIYRLMEWIYFSRRNRLPAASPERPRVELAESLRNLTEMVDAARTAGALVILIPPLSRDFLGGKHDQPVFAWWSAVQARFKDQVLIPDFATLAAPADEKSAFIEDGYHPNALGSLAIAVDLRRALRPRIAGRLSEDEVQNAVDGWYAGLLAADAAKGGLVHASRLTVPRPTRLRARLIAHGESCADEEKGAAPIAALEIDGREIERWSISGPEPFASQPFEVAAGAHEARLVFTNGYSGPGCNRTLFVESLELRDAQSGMKLSNPATSPSVR